MSTIPDKATLKGRWRSLGDRAVFRLTGPDRVRYLNGQVSNNVAGPLDREAAAACLCTIKGKVEALVWIEAAGDALFLDGEGAQRDFLLARLDRYLIADDCEIEDVSDEFVVHHHFIEGFGGVASRRIGVPGRDLLLPSGEDPGFPPEGKIREDEWRLLETLALVPRHGLEIDGTSFPAELGLDEWAVDFHKGCYLGQEIVSRIRSVGRVKRALGLAEASEPFLRGARCSDAPGKTASATRDSIPDGQGGHIALALFPKV